MDANWHANNATDAALAPARKIQVDPRGARRKPIPGRCPPLIELTARKFAAALAGIAALPGIPGIRAGGKQKKVPVGTTWADFVNFFW